MAIGVTLLEDGVDPDGGTTVVTDSFTPSANALVLLLVCSGLTGASEKPSSVSGNGMTWVEVTDQAIPTLNLRATLYRAMSASPSAGAVTINFTTSHMNCTYHIVEFTGVDTSGTNGSGALAQFKTATDNGTSVSVTLDSDPADTSALWIGFTNNSTTAGWTPGANLTAIGNAPNDGSPSQYLYAAYDAEAGSADATLDGTKASTANYAAIGVEVRVAASGGGSSTIAFRNASVNSDSSTTENSTIVVDKPTGVVDNDLMIAFVQMSSEATIAASGIPAGWTFLREDVTATISGGGVKVRTYYKKAASEGSSYTWGPGFTAGDDVIVGIVAYSGVHATTPIYDHDGASSDGTTDTTCDAPSVSVTGNGWLVTCHAFNPNASTPNPPFPQTPHPGMNERIDHSSPDSSWEQATMMVADLGPLTVGETGGKTSTATGEGGDGRNVGVALTLQPSDAVGGGPLQTISLDIGTGSGGAPLDGCMHGWRGPDLATVQKDEAILGKQFALVRVFSDKWEPPGETVKEFVANGYLVIWSTKPPSTTATAWRDIADGNENGGLRAIMQGLKALNKEIIYVFMHEPGGNSTLGSQSPTLGTPQDYIDAWKQVDKIAREEGAHWKVGGNVYMGYCDTDNWVTRNPNPMYPGNAIIDFLCHDEYNYYDFKKPTGTWKSFEEEWRPLVAVAKRDGKPLIIGEFGTHPTVIQEGGGGTISYIAEDHDVRPKGSSSITLDIPAAADANDLLLVMLHTDYCTINHTPPTGWNLLTWREEGYGTSGANPNNIPPLTGGTDLCGYIFWKVSDGTETTVTFSVDDQEGSGSANLITGTLSVWRGIDTTNPIYEYATNHQTSGSQINTPSVAVARGGAIVCHFIQDDAKDYAGAPQGMTLIAMYESPPAPANADDNCLIAYQLYSTTGTSGIKTATHEFQEQSPNDMGMVVSLRPGGNTVYSMDQWFRDVAQYITDNADARQWIKGFCYFHKKHTSDWRFTEANELALSHEYQEASGTATHSGYVFGDGIQGWKDAFVNDTSWNNNDADFFLSRPFALSGSESPVPGTGSGGIATGEAWGVPSLLPSDTQIISMDLDPNDVNYDPILTEEAWGEPILEVGGDLTTQTVTGVGAVASEEAWGIPIISRENLLFPQLVLEAFIDGAWVDLSGRIRQDDAVKIIYGRSAPLARFEAGTMSIMLDNRDRALEPDYEGSPYHPFLLPNVPIRLRSSFLDTGYDLFTGLVDFWEPQWDGRDGVCQVSATDGFKIMAGVDLPGSPFARALLTDIGVEPDLSIGGSYSKLWLRLSDDGSSGTITNRFGLWAGDEPVIQGEPQFSSAPLVYLESDGSMTFDTVDDRVMVPGARIGQNPFFMSFWVMFTGETFDRTFTHVIFDQPSSWGINSPGLRVQFLYSGGFVRMQFLSSVGNGAPTVSEYRIPINSFELDKPYYCVIWTSQSGQARMSINDGDFVDAPTWTLRSHIGYQNTSFGPSIGNVADPTLGYGPVAGALDEFVILSGRPYEAAISRAGNWAMHHYRAGADFYWSPKRYQTSPRMWRGAWDGDDTWTRISRALSAIGYSDLNQDDRLYTIEGPPTGTHFRTHGPTAFQGNVLQYVQKVEESEQGAVYIDQLGDVHIVAHRAIAEVHGGRFRMPQSYFGNGKYAVYLPPTGSSYISTPDSVANSITGDLEIEVDIALDNWGNTSAIQTLLAKYSGTTGNLSWMLETFVIGGVRKFSYRFAPDTTNVYQAVFDPGLPSTLYFPDNGRIRVKLTHEMNVEYRDEFGSPDFMHRASLYLSYDQGLTWELQETIEDFGAAGPTSIHNSTSPVTIGIWGNGFNNRVSGATVYEAWVRNGLDGPVVNHFSAADGNGRTSWASDTGETWSIIGSGWSWLSEVPYENVVPDSGDEEIINEVEVSREGGPAIYLVDLESRERYGPKNYAATDLTLQSDDDIVDLAVEVLDRYRQPKLIIKSMKLKAINSTGSQSVMLQILQRQLLDRVSVNVRPPGGGTTKTHVANIQKVTHTITQRKWECDLEIR